MVTRRSLVAARLALALSASGVVLAAPPGAANQAAPPGAANQAAPPASETSSHGTVDGQAAGPVISVTFEDAVKRATDEGPGVAQARAAKAGAVDARQAAWQALVYAPKLTVEAGRRTGGFGPGLELAVGLQQDLSLHGLGRERREVASALVDAVGTDIERARLSAAGRAAMAWVDAVEAREALRLRAASLGEASKAADIARARVKSGLAQPLEQALADGDRATAQAAVIEAEGAQVEALAELRHALGLGPDQPIEAVGALRDGGDEAVDERSAAREAETSHPSLQLAQARVRLARAEARLAGAQQMPSLGLGAQYRLEGTGDRVLTGMVVLPLPFVDPGGFERGRQESQAAAVEAQSQLMKAQIARDVRLAMHDRHHYRELRDALSQGAIGPLTEALRLAQAQLGVGASDVTPVLLARQRLLSAQEQLVRAEAQARRADVRLAELTGSLIRGRRR